jgi:inosine/xanthosine triphosphatase
MKMRVVVGSTNPVKVDAVKAIFSSLYSTFELKGIDVDIEIPGQPFDVEESVRGAILRAKHALVKGDIGVGIEAGLVEISQPITDYLDVHYCAIDDGEKVTVGSSSGFEHPQSVLEEVRKGKTVGEAMEELSGINDIGTKEGAVGYLSKGHLTRFELCKQAVLAAMIPRM